MPAGPAVHDSGGEVLAPEQVFAAGKDAPSAIAVLVSANGAVAPSLADPSGSPVVLASAAAAESGSPLPLPPSTPLVPVGAEGAA